MSSFDAQIDVSPGSGFFDGSTHILPVRVYYEDTDAAGNVYYANYLRYMERGRSDMLRLPDINPVFMEIGGGKQ